MLRAFSTLHHPLPALALTSLFWHPGRLCYPQSLRPPGGWFRHITKSIPASHMHRRVSADDGCCSQKLLAGNRAAPEATLPLVGAGCRSALTRQVSSARTASFEPKHPLAGGVEHFECLGSLTEGGYPRTKSLLGALAWIPFVTMINSFKTGLGRYLRSVEEGHKKHCSPPGAVADCSDQFPTHWRLAEGLVRKPSAVGAA